MTPRCGCIPLMGAFSRPETTYRGRRLDSCKCGDIAPQDAHRHQDCSGEYDLQADQRCPARHDGLGNHGREHTEG